MGYLQGQISHHKKKIKAPYLILWLNTGKVKLLLTLVVEVWSASGKSTESSLYLRLHHLVARVVCSVKKTEQRSSSYLTLGLSPCSQHVASEWKLKGLRFNCIPVMLVTMGVAKEISPQEIFGGVLSVHAIYCDDMAVRDWKQLT